MYGWHASYGFVLSEGKVFSFRGYIFSNTFLFFLRGNKSQFRGMAAIKARIDAGLLLLDDLQLDEDDSSTERYAALSEIKDELTAARDITEWRIDLIEKVDASSVGWTAAAFYEKSNGLKMKADSAKLWAEAEKSAREVKKKAFPEKAPFRYGPAQSGKYPYQSASRG